MHLHATQSDTTTDRILRATTELMAERGYTATTTSAIAKRAGVNEVTLFRQFGSKKGLIRTIGVSLAQADHPRSITADVNDIRAALHDAAEREMRQVAEVGVLAARLAMDAAAVPDVAEVLGSEVGPQSDLAYITELFRTWQRDGRVREGVTPELLAESFSAITSGILMSRRILKLPGEPHDIHTCVDLWCDAILTEHE